MKNKIFRALMVIGILGNVGGGISYLITGGWSIAIMHIGCGLIFTPVYLELKNNPE